MTESVLTLSRFQLEELLESVDSETQIVTLVWRHEDFPDECDFYIQKEFRLMPGRGPGNVQEEE